MPSWSTSDVADEQVETPAGDSVTSKLDSARKLLQQLFAEPEVDDELDQPEQ
jgi:hypothetical protein